MSDKVTRRIFIVAKKGHKEHTHNSKSSQLQKDHKDQMSDTVTRRIFAVAKKVTRHIFTPAKSHNAYIQFTDEKGKKR